ncbi:MAG: hypothetical protein AMJ37_03310 [Dehalococcoidia bacterium DG_18]|nr:MAG: hypothetical protein AMJ37_03310 [Dehalococcoidia bacterium DG_18]
MKAMILTKPYPIEEEPLVLTDINDPIPGPKELHNANPSFGKSAPKGRGLLLWAALLQACYNYAWGG